MNRHLLITIIIAAFTGGASGVIGQRLQHQPAPVAVIDPTVLVAEQIRNIEPGMDDATIQARGQAYAKQLDKAIAEVANDYRVTLLVKPAVISHAPDLTDEVRRRIDAAR